MAELDHQQAGAPSKLGSGGKTTQDISATAQLLTIAWLRWRMFANGFRRRQSGSRQVTGIVMAIVLRLILWPMFALMALVPTIGAGYLVIVCLLPEFVLSNYSLPFYFGGTSLLIIVSVTMDTVAQIQSHLLAHQYEGLIRKNRGKSRK